MMRFVCFIIILDQMFHFSSPSEISPINRCTVLYSFVAVLVMVKLHVHKSVLILRATSGLNFVASCSHLKENITGLDGLWIIKYLYFTNLLVPLSNKCGVGQYMWNDFYWQWFLFSTFIANTWSCSFERPILLCPFNLHGGGNRY